MKGRIGLGVLGAMAVLLAASEGCGSSDQGTGSQDAAPADGSIAEGGDGSPGPRGDGASDAPSDVAVRDSGDGSAAGDAPLEGGPGADASDASVACGSDPWITLGHDAQRTSATNACVPGALTFQWRYTPMGSANYVFHAIAQADGAFLQWSAPRAPYIGTTAVDRVSAAGARVWTFDTGTDSNTGHWATLALGSLIVNDDGIYYLDPMTGTKVHDTGVDNWGQLVPDVSSVYVVNDDHVDGPGLYAGAYDATATKLWTANTYGMCRIDAADLSGGAIAADGGVLFYAPQYQGATGVTIPFGSGVYAFDGATGAQKWFKATTPSSGVSAGGGMVFLVEGGSVVARSEADGGVVWSTPLAGASAQAPALAGGLVLVGTPSGVTALNGATGASMWTAPVAGAAVTPGTLTFTGGCDGPMNVYAAFAFGGAAIPTTTLAVALGSGTVVVTGSAGLDVLSLAGGQTVWSGTVSQASGRLRDPVLVGNRVYVMDDTGLLALQ